jgi:hypothetical protein
VPHNPDTAKRPVCDKVLPDDGCVVARMFEEKTDLKDRTILSSYLLQRDTSSSGIASRSHARTENDPISIREQRGALFRP